MDECIAPPRIEGDLPIHTSIYLSYCTTPGCTALMCELQVGRVGASAVASVLQEIHHQRRSAAGAAFETPSLPVLRRLGMRKCGMDAAAASLVLGGASGLEGELHSYSHTQGIAVLLLFSLSLYLLDQKGLRRSTLVPTPCSLTLLRPAEGRALTRPSL